MSEVAVIAARPDDVRTILRRRGADETTVRLSLEYAEQGTVWIARDQGEVVGITTAHDTDDERYVGDAYVEPSYRGQGIGARLLDTAFGDAADRARSMLVGAGDYAAAALAMRYGLAFRETMFRWAGAIPKEEELARMAAGHYRFGVEPVDPLAHAFGLRALDREARGTVRDRDHVDFALRATGSVFFLNGEFVAYAYVWPDGRVGPIASASQNYIVQILAFALLTLSQRHGASWCTALIPGSNLRVSRAALRAGLRATQGFAVARDSHDQDLSSYVAAHELSF